LRPRDLLACAVLLASAEACGGKTTSVAQTSGVPDAMLPDADTTDASEVGSGGAPEASIPDVRDAGKAGTGGTAADAADARPEVAWNQRCWCKNWQDDVYPKEFYAFPSNCISGLPCQAPTSVCCATSCVSPAVCQNTSIGHFDCHSQPPHDCCNFLETSCVQPEDCAPEGVLTRQPYDAGNVSSVQVCVVPDDAG
jgi:hypothetical protein